MDIEAIITRMLEEIARQAAQIINLAKRLNRNSEKLDNIWLVQP